MAESKSAYRDVARWLIRSTNHVIKSDQHDWHYCTRGDEKKQEKIEGDDVLQ